jgi:DNA invertase Pin-like site-specific DNA recombinase
MGYFIFFIERKMTDPIGHQLSKLLPIHFKTYANTMSKTKKVKVPALHADRLRAFLARHDDDYINRFFSELSVTDESGNEESSSEENGMEEKKEDGGDEYEDCDVSYICDSKVVEQGNGEVPVWHFKAVHSARLNAETWWFSDADNHSCESLIMDYIHDEDNKENQEFKTIYCIARVSSDGQQGETHVSLDAQRDIMKRYILDKHFDFRNTRVRFLTYVGSAYRQVPSILRDLLPLMERGDSFVFYSMDRFSRNVLQFASVLSAMKRDGINLYAVHEDVSLLNSPETEILQHILNGQRESENISRRVRASLAFRRRRGDYIGRAPYGFTTMIERGTNRRKLVDCRPERQIIKTIKQFVRRKWNCRKIADELNSRGLNKRGKRWTRANVYSILKNSSRNY